MSRWVYLNGEFLPEAEARVSIFDRAFLMGDGVYEVTSVLDGRLVDFDGHLARLQRSCDALSLRNPHDRDRWLEIHREAVSRNALVDGMVYLQLTRGSSGDREFLWPDPAQCPPTVVLFTQSKPGLAESPAGREGIKVISLEDLRWGRRDIKSVQLLYACWAKTLAKQAGCDDAWLVEDGMVTEGASSNTYLVKDGRIITRQLSRAILHGITRSAVLRLAREVALDIEERPFSLPEAQAADEAFITSASTFVTPVVEIDGVSVGEGRPGPVVARLREIYIEEMRKAAI
ncbi:MAG: D-amino-acid transaminase [Gammaproteobacteria bacterium]|nr:MAG: D-amino-acid transaminase [Gammaproteobacteria bacterium]